MSPGGIAATATVREIAVVQEDNTGGAGPLLSFSTAGWGDRTVRTNRPLSAARFRQPQDRIIRRGDTPVRLRRRWHSVLVVKALTDEGIAIEETCAGVACEAEVYAAENDAS